MAWANLICLDLRETGLSILIPSEKPNNHLWKSTSPSTVHDGRKISIGKYVLCGGESAASVISEAVLRLLPNVLGNEKSKLENWLKFRI